MRSPVAAAATCSAAVLSAALLLLLPPLLLLPAAPCAAALRVLHISDVHVSEAERVALEAAGGVRLARAAALVELAADAALAPTLSSVDAIVLTGDAVDAKHGARGRIIRQDEREWRAYATAVDALVAAAGLSPERVFDVRGNHDTYAVGVGGYDGFLAHSATARAGRDARAPAHAVLIADDGDGGDGHRYAFVGVDATQRADAAGGLTRALNFYGHVRADALAAVRGHLTNAAAANATAVAFGHYPLSFARGGSELRELLAEGGAAAYLCGHVHTLFGERVRVRHAGGLWELQLADWKSNRALRVLELYAGEVVAAVDVRWPSAARLGTGAGAGASGDGGLGAGGLASAVLRFGTELVVGMTGVGGAEGTPDERSERAAAAATVERAAKGADARVAIAAAIATEYIVHAAEEAAGKGAMDEGAAASPVPRSLQELALDVDWYAAAPVMLQLWQLGALVLLIAPRMVALARKNCCPNADAQATSARPPVPRASITYAWEAHVRSSTRTGLWIAKVLLVCLIPSMPWFMAEVDGSARVAWVAPTRVFFGGVLGTTVERHEGVAIALPHLVAVWLPGLALLPLVPLLAGKRARDEKCSAGGSAVWAALVCVLLAPLLAYHAHSLKRAYDAFGWRCVAYSPAFAWTLPTIALLVLWEARIHAREDALDAKRAESKSD